MTLPYSEGSIFLIPLRNGGYARGIVARSSKVGKELFGYFFGPRLSSCEIIDMEDLKPERAILRIKFGDLGLINKEWSICGAMPNWNRAEWPMPDFARRDPLGKRKTIAIRYSDIDPSKIDMEYFVENGNDLQADALSGYGAVEIKLTKMLEKQPA